MHKASFLCRGDRIRTCDHLVPNQERYRATLHPVIFKIPFVMRLQRYGFKFNTATLFYYFIISNSLKIFFRICTPRSTCSSVCVAINAKRTSVS